MPKYTISARNSAGKTKTVKINAATPEEAMELSQIENPGYAFARPVLVQESFRISGQFVRRTFIAAAKQAGYSDQEAGQLFGAMLRDGRVVAVGQIGILEQVNKYEMI